MLGLLASLAPSLIGGASSLGGALLNANTTSGVSGASRRATNQAVSAYNTAGNIGSAAANQAGDIGANAYSTAAGQGVTGLNSAIGQTTTGTNQALSFLSPYVQGGTGSMSILNDALGINGPEAQAAYYRNFQTDPGFMATQRAGVNALDQSAASGGMLRSGGQMKSLYNYGQQNMQNAFQDRLARLFAVGGQGLTAADNSATIAQGGSNSIADYLRQIGGVRGEGTIGSANSKIGGILGSAQAEVNAKINAANARTGGANNAGILNMYGQGQTNSGINDMLARLSGPLSTYAQNYLQPGTGTQLTPSYG